MDDKGNQPTPSSGLETENASLKAQITLLQGELKSIKNENDVLKARHAQMLDDSATDSLQTGTLQATHVAELKQEIVGLKEYMSQFQSSAAGISVVESVASLVPGGGLVTKVLQLFLGCTKASVSKTTSFMKDLVG